MCPVSCASTPITWFGVSASISVPALMKMRRPSATNALKDALVDDHDLDVLLRQAGSLQDRLGVFAQQLLDLGIADDRRPGLPAWLGLRRSAAASQWLATIASETATAIIREGRLWRVAIVRSARVMRVRSSGPAGALPARCQRLCRSHR